MANANGTPASTPEIGIICLMMKAGVTNAVLSRSTRIIGARNYLESGYFARDIRNAIRLSGLDVRLFLQNVRFGLTSDILISEDATDTGFWVDSTDFSRWFLLGTDYPRVRTSYRGVIAVHEVRHAWIQSQFDTLTGDTLSGCALYTEWNTDVRFSLFFKALVEIDAQWAAITIRRAAGLLSQLDEVEARRYLKLYVSQRVWVYPKPLRGFDVPSEVKAILQVMMPEAWGIMETGEY